MTPWQSDQGVTGSLFRAHVIKDLRTSRVGLRSETPLGFTKNVIPRIASTFSLRRFIWWLKPLYNDHMPISARNKLRGQIEEIQLGDVMAHVVVRIGDNLIESVITRRSVDELKLKKGDTVSAVVKATEVMIQKD
jgi:molybdopterin-binding protein